ncbi:hypothetical protein AY599_08080 [Leptolyngbya valderiana BDU 20041]|nr:hypothetical protein AY599_08080 [Leptolyngbya valderiana BDU 20041]
MTVVTGLFDTPGDAAAAVHTLEARGIPENEISIMAGENFKKDAFAIDSHSKLPEGVAIGAGTGGAVAALAAGLTTVGAVATGGAGLLVAGPIVAALAGAGAGAATGGVVGGAIGAAIPEHEVKHYEDAVQKGSVLVGVHCDDSDHQSIAKQTFKDCDADRVSSA